MIEIILNFLKNKYSFFLEWQSLIGAIIGVLGAVSITFTGFYLKRFFKKRDKIRENIRQIEIALALSLNDLYDSKQHLLDFLNRLDESSLQPLRNNQNPGQFFLSRTNFPPISIYLDQTLLKSKIHSYYVHNKILIIHKNLSMMNKVFKEMKYEYEKILKISEKLIERGATPDNQRREYLKNNESFKTFVEDIINQLKIGEKILAQTKIYNLKLLNKQKFAIWKLEGISFKFFCCRKELETYRSTLKCLDRIDDEIKTEVEKIIKESEDRNNNIDQNYTKTNFKKCLISKYSWIKLNIAKLLKYFNKK